MKIDKIETIYDAILKAESKGHISEFYVDLQADEYYNFMLVERLYGEVPKEGKWSVLAQAYSENYVCEEHREFLRSKFYIEPLRKEHETEDEIEAEYTCKIKGDIRWFRMSSILIDRTEDGKPFHCTVAVRDITKSHQQKEESEHALKEALLASNAAVSAKNDFLSKMSRDIRTPLNAIVGMTAIAKANVENETKLLESLSHINKESKRLLMVINEILDMSRIEAGTFDMDEGDMELSDIISTVSSMTKREMEAKHHNFYVRVCNVEHEKLVGDSLHIQQILYNILSNAILFTEENGTIWLTVSEKYNEQSKLGSFEFVIQDNGVGMKEEFVKQIFEPFNTAVDERIKKYQGSGLGMPVARSFTQMMGGDISIESEIDRGTKVTVKLQLKLQDEEAEETDTFEGMKVLVIDDKEESKINTSAILQELSIVPVMVDNAQAACERMQHGESFRAIFVDWDGSSLHQIQGIEQIKFYRDEDVPIIVLTEKEWSMIEKEAKLAGVKGFIKKPLFRSKIIEELSKGLGLKKSEEKESEAHNSYEGKRVLVVDDNDMARAITLKYMQMLSVEADEAINGKEAVQIQESKPEYYYDAIFMDILMPVMDGYDATCFIRGMEREDCKNIPIIATSANAMAEDIANAEAVGMNQHIAVPMEISKLKKSLEKWTTEDYATEKIKWQEEEERRQQMEELEYQATHDSFTDVYNKIAIFNEVELAMQNNPDGIRCMMVLDLDGFKQVNDLYGHSEGDKVLLELVELLKGMFRETDKIGRFGGDEFIVFMPDMFSHTAIRKRADGVLHMIERHFKSRYVNVKLTSSMGVACATGHKDAQELFAEADQALYEAKNKGKNCFAIYGDEE